MVVIRFMDYGKFLFLIVFFGFIYAAYKIISPFIATILSSIVLAIVFHPLYEKMSRKTKMKNFSAFVVVLFFLILVFIPGIFFSNALFNEGINIYNSVGSLDLPFYSEKLSLLTGLNIPFDRYIEEVIQTSSNVFIKSSADMIRFLATGFIHFFIAFFIMFFLLRDGKHLAENVKRTIPASAYQKTRLFKGTSEVINGMFLGFLTIGIAEFLASLLGFYLFGIPNPVFWSLVIAILSFVPLLGPAMVYIPAAAYLFINDKTLQAVLLFGYFALVLSFYMENILRVHLINKTAKIHPILTILGIFGGIQLFGIIGLIVGPLILSLFVLIYRLHREEEENGV